MDTSTNNISQFKARHPNWLPLPHPCKIEAPELSVSEDDFFSKGQVADFFFNLGTGSLIDSKGKKISFNLNEIELVGPKNSKDYIKAGIKVGYDVARTETGRHITKLKIY